MFAALRDSNIAFSQISAANIFAFNLPPISGLGNASGFEFQVESLAGADPVQLAEVTRGLMLAAQSVPQLAGV